MAAQWKSLMAIHGDRLVNNNNLLQYQNCFVALDLLGLRCPMEGQGTDGLSTCPYY
jgi:hypothetical protein